MQLLANILALALQVPAMSPVLFAPRGFYKLSWEYIYILRYIYLIWVIPKKVHPLSLKNIFCFSVPFGSLLKLYLQFTTRQYLLSHWYCCLTSQSLLYSMYFFMKKWPRLTLNTMLLNLFKHPRTKTELTKMKQNREQAELGQKRNENLPKHWVPSRQVG